MTCPQGNTNTWWTPATQRGTDVIDRAGHHHLAGQTRAKGRRRVHDRSSDQGHPHPPGTLSRLANTSLDHNVKAAALNLIRLDAWSNGEVLDPRRASHLSRLELALAP